MELPAPDLTETTTRPANTRATRLRVPWGRAINPLRIACVILPAALFIGLAWVDYRVELARTRNDVITTTNAVAEHAKTVVETVDLLIARVLDRIGDQDGATLEQSPETHAFLDRLRHELPQIEAVYLIDRDGRIAASSRAYPMPRYDVHDAEYFAAAKARDNDSVDISAPSASTMSGTSGFMISRRRLRDGKFDGVVGVTISRQYFDVFYRAILDRPKASAAGLFRSDGAILVRFPDPPDKVVAVPASDPVMAAVNSGADSGIFVGRSSLAGNERVVAFKRLHDLPLLAVYSIDRSVMLMTWASHAAVIAVCAVLLSALLLATEHFARRRAAVEHEALRRLVEETERRRQAEARAQQSQKMEALGRLTGGVAHDFNNLLSVILGSLELLLRREQDARSRRLMQAATQAAERGAKLTAQMLAFSRKQEIAVRPVDVNAVIRGMDDLLCRTLGPSVRLHYELADGLWAALADVVQLELALLNLAVNARDAMAAGGDLTFRTTLAVVDTANRRTPGLAPGDYVCIQVADTGSGMSDEVRAHAHEPFFTTKGPGGGTGLGLSMVDGFVTELGGALTFDSAPGTGTTVSLYLRTAEDTPPIEMADAGAVIATPRAGRLLVVDDDASVRQSMRAMLEELGHEVVDASSGAQTLELLARDRRFDLLVIDFAMPVMNGAQLATEVTKLWPDVPILFVTGYVENDVLRPWADLGYRTVQKPFTTADLAMAVERAMARPEPAAL